MEEVEVDTHTRMAELQTRVRTRRTAVKTAEAIKTALILPMIQSLGYDPFDPYEVVPGYTQDGSPKIDYAVRDGEEVRIAVLLTSAPTDVDNERSASFVDAVARIDAKCAILTDGSILRVHGRGSERTLDAEPLLAVDFSDQRPIDTSGFEHISSGSFDMAALLAGAAARKAREAIMRSVGDELADPSEGFIDVIAARLASMGLGRPDDIQDLVTRITRPLVNLVGSRPVVASGVEQPAGPAVDEMAMNADELLAFNIVKAMCARHVNADRVVARPAKSYVAILLDDNNRRQIARIHFKANSVKHLGTFMGDNKETREKIGGPSDVYQHEPKILARIQELESMDAEA